MSEEELFRLMDEEMAKIFPALYGAYRHGDYVEEPTCPHCGETIISHFQDGRGGYCKK